MSVVSRSWHIDMKCLFLLHNFTDGRLILTTGLRDLGNHFPSCFRNWEFSLVHFKGMPYGFSLVHPNCQHHCSCISGPLLRKIRETRTQRLWHHNSQSDDRDGHWVTNGRVGYKRHVEKKADSHSGWDREGQREISSCCSEWYAMQNLQIIHFWDFSFNIFGQPLITGNRPRKVKI